MDTLYFSPILTSSSLYFVFIATIITILCIFYGIRNYRFFLWRFFALLLGVLFFEFLTSSLWITANLGTYSYLNGDVSIIMTLFWTSIIYFARFLYDRVFKIKNLLREFIFIVITSSIVGLITIIILKDIGIFSYSPEILDRVKNGVTILGRPLEAVLYFPIFIFVAYSFYKYWELAMYNKLYYIDYKIRPGKDIFVSISSIILIGYLMHPLFSMSSTLGYIYLIVGAVIGLLLVNFSISLASHLPLTIRYFLGCIIFSVLFSSVLSTLIQYEYLTLSDSLKINYTDRTILIPGLHFTDSEMVGVIFFSYLLIAMTKYFKIITFYHTIEIKDENMTFRGWKSIIR